MTRGMVCNVVGSIETGVQSCSQLLREIMQLTLGEVGPRIMQKPFGGRPLCLPASSRPTCTGFVPFPIPGLWPFNRNIVNGQLVARLEID